MSKVLSYPSLPREREREGETDRRENPPGNEVALVCSPLGKIHLRLRSHLTGRILHGVVAVHKFERKNGGPLACTFENFGRQRRGCINRAVTQLGFKLTYEVPQEIPCDRQNI